MMGFRRHIGILFAIFLVVGSSLPNASAKVGDPLRADLDRVLADPRLQGANVGLEVREADTGVVLYSRNAAVRAQPASTTKLMTAAAALEVLGPDFRFDTTVLAEGRQFGGQLAGNLYLRGTGDTTIRAADYAALADKVAASGVRVVRGDLVADDTWFDTVPFGAGWAWNDEGYCYNAEISALTVTPKVEYGAGAVIVRVSPGRAGGPAVVELTPPNDQLKVDNRATTGTSTDVSIQREHHENLVHVTGTVAEPTQEWISVREPTMLVASLFRKALADRGVTVLGHTKRAGTPDGARELARHSSISLRELLVPFMKLSNNMHAEALVKAMGRKAVGQGTWAAGLQTLSDALGRLGVATDRIRLEDGSGSSRMNQLSPESLATLLIAVRAKPWFGEWYAALPIAGKADLMVGGTLRNRMRGTAAEGNVRARTGTLGSTSAISGYVTSATGKPLVFALVENNVLSGVKDLEDAVAIRLANHGGDQDRSQTFATTPSEQPTYLECD
jgi:serine-type D-Ala-D-Ala carboxypeptidase/endopeptidase (penicillin-binding protein 4)